MKTKYICLPSSTTNLLWNAQLNLILKLINDELTHGAVCLLLCCLVARATEHKYTSWVRAR